MRPAVVVDKNILQGWPPRLLATLDQHFALLMPDVLFYEMMSTDSAARALCFSRLPIRDNPIVLVQHVGAYLAHEIDQGVPLGKPSQNPLPISYRFNPLLRETSYKFPTVVADAVAKAEIEMETKVGALVERALSIPDLLEDNVDPSLARPQALKLFEEMILDLDGIRSFVGQFEPPPGERPLPDVSTLDESSAILRHAQASLLMAIDVWARYGALLEQPLTPNLRRKLENDLHDIDYLVLAALEGAFASDEIKLSTMFKKMMPEGLMITRQSLQDVIKGLDPS